MQISLDFNGEKMSGIKLFKKYQENKEAIEELFDRKGVVVAYIFGSIPKKEIGPLSDIDFGVYLDESLSNDEKYDFYMSILNDLISILGDEIDLVLMNNSEILFNFNIIRSGKLLYKRSEDDKINTESRIIDKNADVKYYRTRHVNKMINRFAEKGLE